LTTEITIVKTSQSKTEIGKPKT